MRCVPVVLAALTLGASAHGASAADAPAHGPARTAPTAAQVVVRGRATMPDAIRACVDRPKHGSSATVAVVVDVTDTTKKAEADLARAFAEAASRSDDGWESWQVGPLGGDLSAPLAEPDAVAAAVAAALTAPAEDGPDTLGRLRRTLRGSTAGCVVYVAQAHFEDAVRLEGWIAESEAAGRVFCVIGPEAAFERAWSNDAPRHRRMASGRELGGPSPASGSSPFEPDDPAAPWQGGDTAYPLLPWGFAGEWRTEFVLSRTWPSPPGTAEARKKLQDLMTPPSPAADDATFYRWARQHVDPPDPEADLEAFRAWRRALGPPPKDPGDADAYVAWMARLRASAPRSPLARTRVGELLGSGWDDPRRPLPSGFGPYGLMRAAGATGGCYVLWRWAGAGGRDTVDYDPARLDALGPDLRPRAEILADVSARPRARALLHAWTLLSTARPPLCRPTPPLWADRPVRIEYDLSWTRLLALRFLTAADRDRFLAAASDLVTRLGRVREVLEADVASLGAPADGVDRRLQADADLLLHILQSDRFQMSEVVAGARALSSDGWPADGSRAVSLELRSFVREGSGEARDFEPESVPLRDPVGGAALVAARRAFLARYRGTPFGALVDLNAIWTAGPAAPHR